MNSQVQWKQYLGTVRGAQAKGLDEDLLDLEADNEHFGNWSRNAMATVRTKKAKTHTGETRRH